MIQTDSLVLEAKELLSRQKINWVDCKRGYESLEQVKVKSFNISGNEIKVQWNSGRMTSTSAKVDAASVMERKCFLCKENRPAQQEEIEIGNYYLLVNPFPIFPDHFTISHKKHQPQKIDSSIRDLLSIAKLLSGYCTIFYNGPKCGASAPDHLHFQAGTKNFMTIEKELAMRKSSPLFTITKNSGSIFVIDDALRKYFLFEFDDESELATVFNNFLTSISASNEEPMMNILCNYSEVEKKYQLTVFMREKHRPQIYFSEGSDKILLSPASVDVGGVCILPREEDFIKISDENLKMIFNEVFISREKLLSLQNHLK